MSMPGTEPRGVRRKVKPLSIALFGLFGSGNTGNDGSLEAMLGIIDRGCPAAQLLCICGDPANIERDFAIPTEPIHRDWSRNPFVRKLANLVRAYRRLRGCDLLIVPGTGALDDFGTGPTGLPLALFTWCLAARLRGAKVAFVSIGAGPIEHPLSRWLMRWAVALACYRSYRDQLSKDFVEGIGVRTEGDEVYPDLAFLLDLPANARPPSGTRDVGLGTMTYQGWHNDPGRGAASYAEYLRRMTEFALWLLDRGHRIRLLMGDNSDQRAIDDLQSLLTESRPGLSSEQVRASHCRTLHDLMAQIAETDIVVATRFHSVVCSLKLGRPMVSIGYAKKNDVLMEDAGLGGFCQAVETLDVDLLERQFTELAAAADLWRDRLAPVQERYRARLRQQEARLCRELFWTASEAVDLVHAFPASAAPKRNR